MQLVDDATTVVDDGLSLIREEAQARRAGFNNATMRRAQQAKPHIAKIGGHWRVSPWKPATRDLYYEAHAYVARLNSLAKPIEGNHVHNHEDYQQRDHTLHNLAQEVRDALARNVSAGTLLRLLENAPVEEK